MDIGKVLRDRLKFPVYALRPRKELNRWGHFPSFRVDSKIFFEEDEYIYFVHLFSYSVSEILSMQDAAIKAAAKGLKKDGWEFWLHAANHAVKRSERLYTSEIRFVFKVKNAPQKIKEEEKQHEQD